jgi:hypothetical protein
MNFQDPYGLVVSFGTGGFTYNETDNIFGNVTAGNEFLQYSSGNNVMGDVISTNEFLAYSTGNNTIGDVDTQGFRSFLSNSSGSNTIGNVITAESFLAGSSGNNIIGNVTAGDIFLAGSTGNNTMNTIYVTDDAFAGATPTIKNSIYKIETCGYRFALNYQGRIDIGLWGSDGDQNLPSDIFNTGFLTWIHTFYSNQFNYVGDPDRDILRALANMSNVRSTVIYE